MSAPVDYAMVALALSVTSLALAAPMFVLLGRAKSVPPLLGFLILMLALGGVVGAYGRVALVDVTDTTAEYWVRILVIATRVAAVGAMLYDINWLWKRG